MIGLFLRFILGHLRHHRLETLLCLVGVALGVAVVVGIDGAVNAAVESFGGAVHSLAARSTHAIFADSGGIPDSFYVRLLHEKTPGPIAPMIDRGVLVSTWHERPAHVSATSSHPPAMAAEIANGSTSEHERDAHATLARLIGVDVFAEKKFRSCTSMQSTLNRRDFDRFMTQPNTVVMVAALAKKLHVKAGDDITMTVGDSRKTVHILGTFEPTGVARSQLNNLIVADLATAQELTGSIGKIDRIDTVLKTPRQVAAMKALLPKGYVLRSTQQRAQSLAQLVQSYRLNLNALSLMASFVAVFIVYNSMLISVQQRATSLGILRCLGASRGQMAAVYVVEAMLYAIIGGVLGVLGGWLLSRGLVGYISTTINDLYAAVRPGRVTLDGAMWAKGLGVAIGSCAVGVAVPMLRASATPPVNAFRGTGQNRSARCAAVVLLIVAGILLGGAYGVYRLPGNSPIAGFVIALMVGLGFAFFCPWVTRWIAGLVDLLARKIQAIWLQMAAGGIGRSLGITGVAVAATMLAMAMNISVRTMVSSFRGALGDWLGQRFAADVFVAPSLLVNHKIDATLNPAVLAWVRRQPQVAHININRSIDFPIGGKSTLLFATDIPNVLKTLPMKSRMNARQQFDPSKDVLVSEPLQGRTGLAPGGTLSLDTPTGKHRFFVYGIFYDFGTERGQLMIDRQTYMRDWKDTAISSLHVTLKPGYNRTAVADQWAAALQPKYPIVANSFDQIKVEAMRVFDRTFRVTVVLTWLSGGVAFCGLAGSLLALALARQRDYGILAAVGMSGRQTAAWVFSQGILLAWISAAIAPLAGTILAYVLAYVIQYRSFGWSIPTHPAPQFWLQNFYIATAAAIVAAIYPILRLRRISPSASLRPE